MTKYIQKLPAVFQTVTEKKFFDATIDQVFSKKDSEYLTAYLGRRNPGQYNPITDFYVPEPSKNRTWWQLEATAYSKNEDTTKSNIVFYDDLLDRINYYNGNTLNQDRLFESEYYSFAPPIDYDMILNYQNYYWVDQGPPVIGISGVLASEILGKTSYTTPDTATPPNFTLSSGMIINLLDDENYTENYFIQNYGQCVGIQLISTNESTSFSTSFNFLPWDGTIELSTGDVINNQHWDMNTWEVESAPSNADYITIERGSLNRNLWSRSNKWFHIDVINKSCEITGSPFPSNTIRALRPILQFNANLELYNFGTQFRDEIRYGFTSNLSNTPILLSDIYGLTAVEINQLYNIEINDGDLVCFFEDNTEISTDSYPWNIYPYPITNPSSLVPVKKYIWETKIDINDVVTFVFYTNENTPVLSGDIVLIKENGPYDLEAYANELWHFDGNNWLKSQSKTKINQPPKFNLFDHNGISLGNTTIYPNNNFTGSKIFSYKLNDEPGSYLDPILKLPLVYNALGISYDVVFQNDLITDRYNYSVQPNTVKYSINGYYYYKNYDDVILYNSWNLYNPCNCENISETDNFCIKTSKQRVIDRYVVGYGSEFKFKLSVLPYGYPDNPDIIVSVNGKEIYPKSSGSPTVNANGYILEEINNSIFVNLQTYLGQLLSTNPKIPPVVEIQTYTWDNLNPNEPGYFQIPQQLEANPNQEEVSELSLAELTPQFSSIIQSQLNFSGQSTGINNYRDTAKNNSLGKYILQNVCPLLKSMLVSSSAELDLITGIRFSQDEYTKFKNKFLMTAQQLIMSGFTPGQIQNNDIVINEWVNEILKKINISKEFSNAFAYSYMLASGTPNYSQEVHISEIDQIVVLENFVDLNNPKNALYIYNLSDNQILLLNDQDYSVIVGLDTLIIQINTNNVPVGSTLKFLLYKDCLPTYVPSTPTKIGGFGTYIPKIEFDTSYADPTFVIIGHDGSKMVTFGKYTIYDGTLVPDVTAKDGYWISNTDYVIGSVVSYNGYDYTAPSNIPASATFQPLLWIKGSNTHYLDDYRDTLLLELEKRIYNLLLKRFRLEYFIPLRIESVKSGYFRQTRYTRTEYLTITQPYLNKWATKNKANYRINEWATASQSTATNSLWKLYNYRNAENSYGQKLNLPGNWKGIFQYCYDTIYPNTKPWEMLGFSEQPEWWVNEYGDGVFNSLGEISWPNSPSYSQMWSDIENGVIRKGPSAIIDPYTGIPLSQPMWERPGLSNIMPVDSNGDIISVPLIFNINIASEYAPFDGFDKDWEYGDGGPVEQAWISSSSYRFSIQEFLYIMRPGPYGELLWDTAGTELSPGKISTLNTGDSINPVNWQYIQNDLYKNDTDSFYYWMRPKNNTQIVHAEQVNGNIEIRYGYQRWISDRILFLGQNIGTVFGQKIRTLDVNLGNKFAGFTNKDTINAYIESISPGATTPSLILPSSNFNVILHKGQPIDRYAYSGVIIRGLADGTFVVYGYDLLNSSFIVLDRSDQESIDITVGGTPAEFQYFESNVVYNVGDIVRYNGIYYVSLVTQQEQKFIPENWQRLPALPTVGGISVNYRPVSEQSFTVIPYGTILRTPQEVFDLLIGWGDYLKTQGWVFDEVNKDTNQVNDWLTYAKQFLFWLNSDWAPDSSIQLSPLANKATLIVRRGYPENVETTSNGIYNILDKAGISIPPNQTVVDRSGQMISVEPATLSAGGIYFLQVLAAETEHVLLFDNVTSFNDVLYSPLLRERQQRIKFNGFRSNAWYGKLEAPGYLVIDDQLVPNFDTIVDNMRYFYDSNVIIDNPSVEALGRHLIGYESKSYFDNLELSNDIQYLFYQGFIREKGTKKPIEKLFRSTKTQNSEEIEIYEEWALKIGDFGNTVGQVSTEFILKPEQNSGEVIVARLNFVPSNIGFVKHIYILNAESVYTLVPKIIIDPADAQPSEIWTVFSETETYQVGDIVRKDTAIGNAEYFYSLVNQGPGVFDEEKWQLILATRNAKAYAILDSNNRLSRIDISDPGYGYTKAPYVSIDTGTEYTSSDKLYSIWQGEVLSDSILDNVINIDIDEPNIWVKRPIDPSYSLKLPETNRINYSIPNAGYANFDDVNYDAFDVVQLTNKWGNLDFNPTIGNTIWIAKNFIEDWGIYKLVYAENELHFNFWKIIEDNSGQLLLLTNPNVSIGTEFTTDCTFKTDFGNMLGFQQFTNGKVNIENTYTVAFAPYITESYISPGIYVDDETLIEYNAYLLTDTNGVPLTSEDIPGYASLNIFMLFKTMRFLTAPSISLLPYYIEVDNLLWVDDVDGKWVVYKINSRDFWDISTWDYLDLWDGPIFFEKYRQQEPLINTTLFESATIFSSINDAQEQITLLPVYDPFKDILPGLAKQNLTYILSKDPAKYNVTGDDKLFSENIIFGEKQVGQLWWDTSNMRYVYYEQPIALDGSESEIDNLIYRRDKWGTLFPGSLIEIYEWVKSPVPPSEYVGSGIPRSTTTYVQISTSNRFTNITETNYYFWVLNTTDKPNIENRTLAALDVANILQNPKNSRFIYFSPIQQTISNNSYIFYNVQEILIYKGNNVQIQYRLQERNDQEHTQWSFFREGDPTCFVTDQFWNKMVDSLCGYTKLLPVSDEYGNGIIIANNLPWDIGGWDLSGWDSATVDPDTGDITTSIYGEILPVPDPNLGEAEKYGITYRPRQGMFKNITAARKIFVQSANSLLQYINIRELNPTWDANVQKDEYWAYTNWVVPGYENATPQIIYSSTLEAQLAIELGQILPGTIVQVMNYTPDNRYALFIVKQENQNIPIYTSNIITIENAAIKLLDTIYTTTNRYNLVTELRELLNAFRTEVMINQYLVDQNALFFSMLNYVLSEQRTPDWVFKTSYIYIKETNIPLEQTAVYRPNQTENIVDFITDAKPYHTQIRNYTAVYTTTDVAYGTSTDELGFKLKLKFSPGYSLYNGARWDVSCEDPIGTPVEYLTPMAWDSFGWDSCPSESLILSAQTFTQASNVFGINQYLQENIDQFVSRNDVYTIQLTEFDPSKIKLSTLYPYTFNFDTINLNNPQTFVSPSSVVAVQVGTNVLLPGQDYYVEYNTEDSNYTVYFYENPEGSPTPVALVWFFGGGLQNFNYNPYRTEIAYTYPADSFVINVNTKKPISAIGANLSQPSVLLENGDIDPSWYSSLQITISNETISYKENLTPNDGWYLYRNSNLYAGELISELWASTQWYENLDVIVVYVDPTTHLDTNILPDASTNNPGVLWINGERIEYRRKNMVSENTWKLSLIRRGTRKTAAVYHPVGSRIFVEKSQNIPGTLDDPKNEVWNASLPTQPNPNTRTGGWVTNEDGIEYLDPNLPQFSNVNNTTAGGLWYSSTDEAIFLRAAPGDT